MLPLDYLHYSRINLPILIHGVLSCISYGGAWCNSNVQRPLNNHYNRQVIWPLYIDYSRLMTMTLHTTGS